MVMPPRDRRPARDYRAGSRADQTGMGKKWLALGDNHAMAAIETSNWDALADKSLAGERLSRVEALDVLHAPDEEVLSLLAAVFRVRRAHFGLFVKLNMIVNAKSGICPEDCGYCSQSIVSTAEIPKYSLVDADVLVAGAHEAWSERPGRTASSRAAAGRARVSSGR